MSCYTDSLWGCIKCEKLTIKWAACDETMAERGAAVSVEMNGGEVFAEKRGGFLEARMAFVSPGSFVKGCMP